MSRQKDTETQKLFKNWTFRRSLMAKMKREIHKLIPKQMLLHAERPLGISLRIFPCNSSIQACIKSVGNHAKKSYLA